MHYSIIFNVVACVTGCTGRMGCMPATVALLGANLQFRGHQSPVTGWEQEISDHGPTVA